jgi:hypothetical protein
MGILKLVLTKINEWDTFSENGSGVDDRAFTNAEFERLIEVNK